MFRYLTKEVVDQVCWIRFNRPHQLNAMNRDFMDEIIEAFSQANADDSVRVVVVTGEGRAFMAGADIKEYATQTDEQFRAFQEKGWQLYRTAEQSTKPYLAMVNGFALGGGFEIALACDMIFASETAVFGLPEVHIGLVPGGGGTQKLIHRVGLSRAMEILMLGGKHTAAQMHQWGVVNHVTSAENLQAYVGEIAQKLTRRMPEALGKLKYLLRQSTNQNLIQAGMEEEAKTLSMLFYRPDVQNKLKEFMNKNEAKN